MVEGDKARLIAWGLELRAVHTRLREALHVTLDAARAGETTALPTRELLLFCHGFCTALTGHHQGEDRTLFPAIAAEHPELAPTLRNLEQDHAMIGTLVAGFETSLGRDLPPDQLESHLEGIAAIMESHFRYEERELLTVLGTLALDANVADVLGPL
ncbi:MAG: hemerythrin domain-containing protein [Acidipropionibacterium acidipropionici]|jgi:hemerythrin-like domain-containing protein|uniref:hemerythrin domain-containing protein n=1 Tax=Acidipropionibacterium acidipropionici TaxID=1748 RepID=UPI002F359DF5